MYLKHYRSIGIAVLTAGHFSSDFYATFLPAIIPFVMKTMNLSLASSGLLVMFYSVTSNILQPFCGYYIDKYNMPGLILLGIPLSAIFMCSSVLATDYFYLTSAVLLAGLGVSLFHPLGSSLVNKIAYPRQQGIAMSIFIGGGNFGFAIAPAVVSFWLVTYGARNLLWLVIPGFLVTLSFYLLRLHQLPLIKIRHSTLSTKWYHSPGLLALNAVMGLRAWTQVAIMTFLPILLVQQGYTIQSAGNLLTVFLIAGAAGGFIGGFVGDKIGHKQCILVALILSLPALYLLFSWGVTTNGNWIYLAFAGACLQGIMPSSIILAQTMLPNNKAMASGMMLGLSSGIGGAGTALTGLLADNIGLNAALLITIIPTLLAIPFVFGISNPVTEKSLTNI